jgi:hypothetical protein
MLLFGMLVSNYYLPLLLNTSLCFIVRIYEQSHLAFTFHLKS